MVLRKIPALKIKRMNNDVYVLSTGRKMLSFRHIYNALETKFITGGNRNYEGLLHFKMYSKKPFSPSQNIPGKQMEAFLKLGNRYKCDLWK